jgi:predicted dehydrogenase
MPDPVRIAVVGAGLIGQAHIKRIRDEPSAELAAIVDPSPQAKGLADTLAIPWFPEVERMLDGGPPHAAIIATPNALHVAGGLACIGAGVPILVEKPIAEDVASATRLVEAAEAAGVPILVGHHRRHSPLIRTARDIIRSGRLGRITVVNGLCWFLKPKAYFDAAWRREPGGGVVLINLIHVIDDLRNLCGEIASVQAAQSNSARGFPVEDTAAILLRFQNGALGTLSISDSAAAPWSWELTSGENKAYPHTDQSCYFIAGTEGSLAVPRGELWRHKDDRAWFGPIACERDTAPEEDPLTLQMRHFCDVARRLELPLVGGRDAIRTLAATLAVKEAASAGGPVHLT